EAVRRGFGEFLLIGVTGGRFDHTFGNISLLLYLDGIGKKAQILDDTCLMEIVSRQEAEIDGSFSFFSLLNISGTARDITIRGAKYPLNGGEITSEYQYGISNEVLPGETATVSVGEGKLLLVKVF
ncbi:MAG: thiamine diphosphokinase, partial [Clostridia bacterium]